MITPAATDEDDIATAMARLRRSLESRLKGQETAAARRRVQPTVDRERLGRDVARRMVAAGLSYSQAADTLPGLNRAMLSRAVNGRSLSAPSMLALCRAFGLKPLAYLVMPKEQRKQAVTEPVPRETPAPEEGL